MPERWWEDSNQKWQHSWRKCFVTSPPCSEVGVRNFNRQILLEITSGEHHGGKVVRNLPGVKLGDVEDVTADMVRKLSAPSDVTRPLGFILEIIGAIG
ncbi:hypothetical protein Tdes44962_MAKER00714 [Teratosphaeria destructans]|uniref:Uncharacterized protein n=1 Tax=Teratosphaeria destructans TaxID=418781 RepID=A0A9W7SLV2_9PEZI|nr:hypothetical protein Tdes44962_MAKER00714 [Teratosphaeria destructans]